MPPREWLHRIVERSRILEDRALGPARHLDGPGWDAIPPLACDVEGQPVPASLEAQARAVLDGRIPVLGEEISSDSARWDVDPRTGESWATSRHGHDTGFRNVANRDIKMAWEIHRLRHLQLVALWGAVAGEDTAKDWAAQRANEWLQRPPFEGIAWAAGIECAHRVAALLTMHSLLGERMDERLLADSLRAHGLWIERYPSLFSSANNHRLAELCALVLLASVAPESAEGKRWIASAVPELEALCDRLWTPCGGYRERSPSYQARSQEWLLLVRRWTSGTPWAPGLDEVLGRSNGFLRSLVCHGGHVLRIGDDDGSVVFDDGAARDEYERSVLSATAVALGEPSLAPSMEPSNPLRVLFLTGGFAETARPAPLRSNHFREYGMTALVGEGSLAMQVWMDHGSMGLEPLCAHGHADKLAVWAAVAGHPVLVDSGTYRYAPDRAWRDYMRGATAHNTLSCDDYPLVVPGGPFLWARRYAAACMGHDLSAGWVEARLQPGLGPRLSHVRRVAMAEDGWTIRDHVEGEGLASLTWHFHFDASIEVSLDGKVVKLSRPGAFEGEVTLPAELEPVLLHGGPQRPGPGGYSRAYNQWVPCTALRLRFRASLPLTADFRWVFRASST